MHALLQNPLPEPELHKSWRHHEGAEYVFNSAYAAALMQRFNINGDADAIESLLKHSEPLIKSLIRYRMATKHVPADEMLAATQLKIWRSCRLFNPQRGSAFSFVAMIANSVIASAISESWQRGERCIELDESLESFHAPKNGTQDAEDLIERVRRSVKTTVTEHHEVLYQRWFFQSLAASEFVLRRHQICDAGMQVYALSHENARQLVDMVLLESRRVLLADRRVRIVPPSALRSTRSAALRKYAAYLSEQDFSKLILLLKDLPPHLVLSAKPENRVGFRIGDADAI
jgi:hypothetical protein